MTSTGEPRSGFDDGPLLALLRAIAAGNRDDAVQRLESSPDLAIRPVHVGASRGGPDGYFLVAIRHHLYRGDTALHIAAAARQRELAELLAARGAAVRGRNRRGAEPLHYAADGRWDPDGQREVIVYLIEHGADPNALDNSGVAPIHRAVRTRSSRAVKTLIEHGADPLLKNKSGSTPLHLAVQNTGASGSGTDAAKQEQGRVIAVLLEHGASPNDLDAKGKSVAEAASSVWVRDLLGVF
jgi:ankyrin repeat protein